MAHILLVEDEQNLLKMAQMMLKRAGHEVDGETSGVQAISRLEKEGKEGHGLEYDIVITDYRLNDVTGLDVLHAVKRIDDSTQVLLMTAYATTQTAVEAMRDGAFDYIEKPFKSEGLLALVEKANECRQMKREKVVCSVRSDAKRVLPNFVGESPAMKDVLDIVSRVAPTRANILITGESGTGKEVIARAIHELSDISGPFVPVNCGAIPETLVESEFFGYVKGAFTGANSDKVGYFQAARGGSLFLDEIGELPLQMQVKLLRAIQEKKIQPVGSTKEVPVTVRIIAATNRDLRAEVDAHRFREDLFFRLNVIQLVLPSLRERKCDIPKLIHHFLQKFNKELGKSLSGVEPEAMEILMNYSYRGNVRELENIIEHAATMELSQKITVGSLPDYLRLPSLSSEYPRCEVTRVRSASSEENCAILPGIAAEALKFDAENGIELEGIVENLERKLIEQSLEKAGGNKTEAARLLGISFRSLRYRLKKYEME